MKNEIENLKEIAKTIRGLSIDAVEAAQSGHPGMPLGCAEIAAYLFGKEMRYNPANPDWVDRDRFILSSGHASMLLYSALHLSGYDLSLDDIKNFRQLDTSTAGHPEYGAVKGIETTSGPLGQGIAIATGMALGHKIIQDRFEFSSDLLQATFFVLTSDGCLMEGISSEAASLAGHLKLDNLVLIYDSNDICLDGPTSECFTDNTKLRFQSYGWEVLEIDGHDLIQIDKAIKLAKNNNTSPTLIIAKTIIGKGSPNYAGTNDVHGKALGKEEAILTKKYHKIPTEPLFFIPESVINFFKEKQKAEKDLESLWQEKFNTWAKLNPEKAKQWDIYKNKKLPANIDEVIKSIEIKPNQASRQSSSNILQEIYKHLPFLQGGSADLSGSDKTYLKNGGLISSESYKGKNIKFGVREFAMSAISSGLALHGMFLPFCGTFLVFSDYMRNSIRLASLMNLSVIYQFTHDSFYVGEDGPTHQPVEHIMSLRVIPNLTVIRPADSNEVKGAWSAILKLKRPVVLSLSRQNLPDLTSSSFELVSKGAYIIKKEAKDNIDWCLLASGSEVDLALKIAEKLEAENKSVRVISFPSFELFENQTENYKQSIFSENIINFCSIEAGCSLGWHKYIGKDGISISIDHFGKSAPAKDLADHFGFTVDKILKKLNK